VNGFGVSIGICIAPGASAEFERMYRGADHALYSAKSGGKNRYVIFEGMSGFNPLPLPRQAGEG